LPPRDNPSADNLSYLVAATNTVVSVSGRLSNAEICGKCTLVNDVVLDTTGMVDQSTTSHGTGTCYGALGQNALQVVPGSHDTSLYSQKVAKSNSLVDSEPVDSSISWLFSEKWFFYV
jgi:hypothetical protein